MSEIKAGRELDALVAEKVMGWVRRGDCWYSGQNIAGRVYFDAEDGDAFSPSEEIADAWLVVEKMCEAPSVDQWAVGIYHAPSVSSVCWGWNVGFRRSVHPPQRGEEAAWAREETLPLAICLAALRAVGHDA